jgi:hypothetical protein
MLATTRHRFLDDYIKIRHAEGRGSQDSAYYLALPYRDITGRLQDNGRFAPRAFASERRVLPPIEKQFTVRSASPTLRGNCWLSYAWLSAATGPSPSTSCDPLDGLTAGRHYQEHGLPAR